MEEKKKRKIDVEISGISLSLITDEPDSFVDSIVRRLDETMSSLLSKNYKRSRLDAAMLCAIDFCGAKLTAEKRIRNLEAQISLYDVNIKRLRDEVADLKKQCAHREVPGIPGEAGGSGAQIPISGMAAEMGNRKGPAGSDVPARVEDIPGQGAASAAPVQQDPNRNPEIPQTKADKLRLIESLLRPGQAGQPERGSETDGPNQAGD